MLLKASVINVWKENQKPANKTLENKRTFLFQIKN